MPTLLSDLAPDKLPNFGPWLLGRRPHLAALVAETISTWSYTENALGKSVATMSRGVNATEMKDYMAKWRLPARMEIVRRIACSKLTESDLTPFLKVLDVIEQLASKRHAFAHGLWGTVEALPDSLLLVDPEHVLRHWGEAYDRVAAFSEGGPGAVSRIGSLDNRSIEVWSELDLEKEVDGMNQAYELALALEMLASVDVFDASDRRRTHAHNLLRRNPLVRP